MLASPPLPTTTPLFPAVVVVPSSPAAAPTMLLPPIKSGHHIRIQKVQAQFPAAKYLIRRRHSLAPEAMILEGRALGGTNDGTTTATSATAKAAKKGGDAGQGRSCRIHSSSAVPSSVQQQKADAAMAIDSKIEQAMDLVKTHLIYAVRDEIELLRARIVELETTVIQLEVENAVLRDHMPRDVLAHISSLLETSHPKQITTKQQQLIAANLH